MAKWRPSVLIRAHSALAIGRQRARSTQWFRRRPRGRPPYDFLGDPERYAISLIDALVVLGTSETDAFKIAAAQIVGIPMGCRTVGPRRKRGRGLVRGGLLVNYDYCSPTIVGKADTLRRKFKRPMSPEEHVWRRAMGHAFLLVLRGKDWHRCASKIEELAKSMGEAAYAQTELLPMLAAKFVMSDFMPDVQTEIL